MRARTGLLALVLTVGIAACGTDDGADVRTIGSEGSGSVSGSASGPGSGSASGSGPASGSASGSGPASGSASGSGSAAAAECVPVGEGGGTPVDVVLGEWVVEPDPAEVEAGSVTFLADNAGSEVHELVIVRATRDELTVTDGQVDEEALPDGAFIGEIEGFPAGETCEGTFELAAGDYTLFCNIVETEEDGTLESHYEEGMVAEFTVR